jgi:hypothetical protein
LASRDRALEEFRHAAAVHIHEVERLRSAVSEQTAHVTELEEALADAEARATEAMKEADRARLAQALKGGAANWLPLIESWPAERFDGHLDYQTSKGVPHSLPFAAIPTPKPSP